MIGCAELGGCLVACGLAEWRCGILVLEVVGSDAVLLSFNLPLAPCPVCSATVTLLSTGQLLTSTLPFKFDKEDN